MGGTCQAGQGNSVLCRSQVRRKLSPSVLLHPLGWTNLWHLGVEIISMINYHISTILNKYNKTTIMSVCLFMSSAPGLKRTMALRQPSSVLSICMSFIFDTSSVNTLHKHNTTFQTFLKQERLIGLDKCVGC